ncbi:MAG: membrane dipeptidase [Oscillospiraceae bacterium]|nr:membrane dipeptidase [Oscillospiraceae bacterium]MDD3833137.1 membrane dipeptidase [Oscillospiraceae bacterium]MDD4545857.1 membrane dipeptidase [Oscillospiraceae bacterium]
MRLFDMHCDTLYECVMGEHELSENSLHIDLKRGLEFDAWGQVFAVWMPDTIRGEAARQQCRRILERAHTEAVNNPDKIIIVYNSEDLDSAFKSRRCATILAVEGGSALGGRLETIDIMSGLGVKIITLTWNGANELGNGCLSGNKAGLTKFGIDSIKKMESANIVPDVSHLNEAGFWDVIHTANRPIIASHSVSAGVFNHPRNLTDEQFKAVINTGGLVGITLCCDQLGKQTFECIQRHIEHYLSLDGSNNLAFGCDFDGADLPADWGGIQVMEDIYEYLYRKNYEEYLLDRLFFSNCYDFYRTALTNAG